MKFHTDDFKFLQRFVQNCPHLIPMRYDGALSNPSNSCIPPVTPVVSTEKSQQVTVATHDALI